MTTTNDRIRAAAARLGMKVKPNAVEASENLVKSEIANRVSAALSIEATDTKLVTAMGGLNFAELQASFPAQNDQITAGVRKVIAAFEQLDNENNGDNTGEEDEAIVAFTASLNNVLATLLMTAGSAHVYAEDQIAAAITANAEHILAAFTASDDLEDQLADAVPVVLSALGVDLEDDSNEDGDLELEAMCTQLTAYINAHAADPKRMTKLAASLNAVSNMSLAALSENS